MTSILDLLTIGPKFTRSACRAAAATIDRYLLPAHARPTSAANPPAADAALDRRVRQTDGHSTFL